MVDFIKSIKLPFTDWKSLAIGTGLMAAIYVALIVIGAILFIFAMIFQNAGVWIALALSFIAAAYLFSFIFAGYIVRIANNAMRKKNSTLPKWDDWKGLLEDGYKVSLVYLAYYAVPLALIIAGLVQMLVRAYTLINRGFRGIELLSLSATATSAIFIIAGVFILVLVSYFGYMAMLSYASRRKLGDAFKIKEVISKSMRGGYFLGFLFLFAYTFGIGILGAAASTALSILGSGLASMAISYFVSMITLITISDAMGQVYAEK